MRRGLNAARPRIALPMLVCLWAGVGCAAPGSTLVPAVSAAGIEPTRAELAYVTGTARTLYRGRPVERSATFLTGGPDLRICVRSPVKGGYDHTLLTLQRRITDDFIPQAADDVLIERTRAGVEACRRSAIRWIALR